MHWTTARRGVRPEEWSFLAGLGLIATATVVNIGLEGMSLAELNDLPPVVGDVYRAAGKPGLTALFVSLGLAVIGLGQLAPDWFRRREAAPLMPAANTGGVALATAKYLYLAGDADRQTPRPPEPPDWLPVAEPDEPDDVDEELRA